MFEGVTLVQITHVMAAKAEGFVLEDVLAAEGLGAEEFVAADVAYKAKLGDPDVGASLFAAYEFELGCAEERFSRRVRPLDEDIEAWTRFLAAYGASKAPRAMLDALGLTMPDLARLARTWKRRMEADRALARKAAKLAKDHDPEVKPPAVRVEPAKLVPSPHARSKPIAAVKAPSLRDPLLPRPRAPGPPPAISGTGLALDIPRGPALPFVEADDEPASPPPRVVNLPPREALSGTALSLDIPRGPSLPFVGADGGRGKPLIPEAAPAPPAPPNLAGTALALDIPRGPALPFVSTIKPADPQEKAGEAAPSFISLPRPSLSGTSLALDVPRGPDTPFEVKEPPEDLVATSLYVAIPRELLRKPAHAPAPPKLTLVQHAALTVELVMAPEHATDVLARYQITAAEREALDIQYKAIVGADENQRSAWYEAYKAHYTRIAGSFGRR